jgi:beta-galactosidase
VDYAGHRFLKDGRPYRYLSGEIHYFRIHSSLWQDRLMRVRAAGLNAVQVYVPWNYHEVEPGK